MKIAIIGLGGCARDMAAHILNDHPHWTIQYYLSDRFYNNQHQSDNIRPLSSLSYQEEKILVAIGDPEKRAALVENEISKKAEFLTFIHSSALILDPQTVQIGQGSFVSARCVLTTNIRLGCHSQLNLNCTLAHDISTGDYFTTAPGVNVSGNCTIGHKVYLGTNSSLREKINIADKVTLGLGAGVTQSLLAEGVYVKTPAQKIK